MYPTAEVRWFYRGPIPQELLDWFRPDETPAADQPPRTDRYLFLPDHDALGIKLRQGRLELKQRQGRPDQAQLHEEVSGLLELWHKWSFPLAELPGDLAAAVADSASWLAVEKQRYLRRYQLARSGQALLAPVGQVIGLGCEWELARVRYSDHDWWTVAFEAFGDQTMLKAALLQFAAQFLDVDDPPALDVSHSYSYPRWLQEAAAAESDGRQSHR